MLDNDASPDAAPPAGMTTTGDPDAARDARVPATLNALAAYGELASIVLGREPLGAVLTKVARIAAEVVPGIDEASITLIEGDRPRSVAFSGRRAPVLDERQYADGFGPCMDAAVTGTTIVIEDTADEKLYPGFAAQAVTVGITHTVAVGLPAVVQGRTGALNLYGSGTPQLPDALEVAEGLSGYVAVAVTNASVFAGALDEVNQMRAAMESRAVIEQAKGIVMAGRRCTAEEAFDVMRDTSSRSNRKLRDIAEAMVREAAAPAMDGARADAHGGAEGRA